MSDSARVRIEIASLSDEAVNPADVIAAVSLPGNGGISVFIGTVRNMDHGRAVIGLEYSAYREMAEREMAAIVHEAAAIADGVDVAAVHRVGALSIGDVAVAIAAGNAHRGPAFMACHHVIEQLKRRVPIWKSEIFAEGAREWVAPPMLRAKNAR